MTIATFTKDPEAVLDYTIDWATWLLPNETISTTTWTVPAGLTKDSDTKTAQQATVWLSSGTAGTSYTVEVLITTSQSRTDERSITISVAER